LHSLSLEHRAYRHPSSVEALQGLVRAQKATIEEQAQRISLREEWKRLAPSQRFGSRSERLEGEQGRLFNEAELASAEIRGEDGEEVDVPGDKRRKGGHRPLPGFLPVAERLHDLSAEEKVCAHDASHALVEIGREASDPLNFIPARAATLRHIRPKYACPALQARREGCADAEAPGAEEHRDAVAAGPRRDLEVRRWPPALATREELPAPGRRHLPRHAGE
jgi:transposase